MSRKAFISYSIDEREMYVISAISKYLSEKGYQVYSGYDVPLAGSQFSQFLSYELSQCDLFIGIASHMGIQSRWVLKEWEQAQNLGKNSIFLVEDTVELNPEFIRHNKVIQFNRAQPQESLRRLESMVEQAKADRSSNALNWIVGGLIGIAVIKLLTDD